MLLKYKQITALLRILDGRITSNQPFSIARTGDAVFGKYYDQRRIWQGVKYFIKTNFPFMNSQKTLFVILATYKSIFYLKETRK